MLTGKFPEKNTSPVARFHPHNLFTLLGGVYDVRAEESITGLCPPSVCAAPAGTSLHGLGGVLDDAASVLRDKLTPGKSRSAGVGVARRGDRSPRRRRCGPLRSAHRLRRGLCQHPEALRTLRHGDGRVRDAATGRSTSCTSCCRTSRGASTRRASSTRCHPTASEGSRAATPGRTRSGRPSSAANDTCCSCSTPTGCSASCSTACSRPVPSTARSSS